MRIQRQAEQWPDMPSLRPDTPQQKYILRVSPIARKVRKNFPYGTRVQGAPGNFGTVVRHVPGSSADGGYLVVQWDNGRTGRHTVVQGSGITKVDQ